MEITSVNNEYVKNCAKLQQKKFRDQSGKFLIEGYKAIKEAFEFGLDIENVFVNKDKIYEFSFAKDKLIQTTDSVLKKISTTDTPPEAVAVAVKKDFNIERLRFAKRVILLENAKDTGNIGTIVRTAVAFGVDAIILFGDCADLYNPKIVRSAVGNLWKIPIYTINDIQTLKNHTLHLQKIATLPRSKNYLKNFIVEKPVMIMFGSEADGLSEELIDISTSNVKIEMSKEVESLNLATSVAVVAYKLFIQ